MTGVRPMHGHSVFYFTQSWREGYLLTPYLMPDGQRLPSTASPGASGAGIHGRMMMESGIPRRARALKAPSSSSTACLNGPTGDGIWPRFKRRNGSRVAYEWREAYREMTKSKLPPMTDEQKDIVLMNEFRTESIVHGLGRYVLLLLLFE